MNIVKEHDNGKTTLLVDGHINTTTAPDFEKQLLAELQECSNLVLDLDKVEYVSSAGLRAFLNAQKLANKTETGMLLRNVCDEVLEVFEMTGFIDILQVE